MDYFLNERQQMIKSLARRIAEERVLPFRAELDEREEFPWELMGEMAQADMFRVFIPEEYDGLGGGCLDLCLVIEELSRVCAAVAISYGANALGASAIIKFGSDEQKRKYLPEIAAGRRLAAFGLTEASAGSDAAAIKTTAIPGDGAYILNGTKQFITNGGDAEIYTIIALTSPNRGARGASALIVEKDTPGFTFGKKESKMGIRASSTRELVFRNCAVPAANLVGREGAGFLQTLKVLDSSRPGIAAQALGIAQGALEAAVGYARERVQFGHPVIAQQAVAHLLADMAIKVEASRALTYAVARSIDGGDTKYSEEAGMVKVFASDTAMSVTTDAVQVFGGPGYMKDYPVEKMMRDAKITQIYEGTNQTIRNTIAAELRKRKGRRD